MEIIGQVIMDLVQTPEGIASLIGTIVGVIVVIVIVISIIKKRKK